MRRMCLRALRVEPLPLLRDVGGGHGMSVRWHLLPIECYLKSTKLALGRPWLIRRHWRRRTRASRSGSRVSWDARGQMDDWLEDDEETVAPAFEQRRREREYAHLESRMSTLGFSDGVAAGQDSVMQDAFDAGYREGLDSVFSEDVRFRSVLSTFVEFYARHGVALGMPVSIATIVFRDEPCLGADEVVRRLAALVCNSRDALSADSARWAALLGWGRAGEALSAVQVTPPQFDVAVQALLADTSAGEHAAPASGTRPRGGHAHGPARLSGAPA